MTGESLFNFFAYMRGSGEDTLIKRIPLSRELQNTLSYLFAEKIRTYLPEGSEDSDDLLKFTDHIDYKPEEGQLLFIEDFEIPEPIINALQNPVSLDELNKDDFENIRSIFCAREVTGGGNEVVFNTFDSRKIIKSTRWKTILFYRQGVFTDFEDKMLVIEEKIDALFRDGTLFFRSFMNAKKIFGDLLNEYFREATDDEVQEFSRQFFSTQIPEEFLDTRARKLIFSIIKAQSYPEIRKVVEIGRNKFGLRLETGEDGSKLKVPADKKDFKKFLKLLNDDLLESPLTESKYETNSKRKIS